MFGCLVLNYAKTAERIWVDRLRQRMGCLAPQQAGPGTPRGLAPAAGRRAAAGRGRKRPSLQLHYSVRSSNK